MDVNENYIYLNSETVESKILAELNTPVMISAEQVDTNDVWLTIVKEVEITIPIPVGYRRILGDPTRINMSIDQHNITPVIIKKEIPVELNFMDDTRDVITLDTSAEIYLIKLVGNLYYNATVSNFEPIKSSLQSKNTIISQYGGILMNDKFGYVSDINHIPANLRERLKFNIVIDSTALRDNNKVRAMEIAEYITVNMTVMVKLNQGPIS